MNNLVIFIHINKSAGTFVKSYVNCCVGQEQWKVVQTESENEEFNNMPNKNNLNGIGGHIYPYRVKGTLQIEKPYTYITSLREPVDRALSVYYFSQSAYLYKKDKKAISSEEMKDEMFYSDILKATEAMSTPQGFREYNIIAKSFVNGQTRWLGGNWNTDEPNLEQAIDFIETSVSYICLDTEMKNMENGLSNRFKWEEPPLGLRIHRPNANAVRKTKPAPTAELKEKIEKLNELDIQLYKYVSENIERLNSRPIIWIDPNNKDRKW